MVRLGPDGESVCCHTARMSPPGFDTSATGSTDPAAVAIARAGAHPVDVRSEVMRLCAASPPCQTMVTRVPATAIIGDSIP